MTSRCKPVCLTLVIGVICQLSTVYCHCVPQEVRVHITGGKLTRWPGYLGICVLILDLRFGMDHCATNEWQCEFGFVNSLCGRVETISKWVVSRADDSTCIWFSWPLCVVSGTHIQVVQQSEIVPEKFFRNGIQKYELPPVNFTRAEQNMTDDYVHLGYWAWSVPVQTTVDRAASASLNAFLAESAAPCHEGSVSGSNDPMSADLHDDTSSLQPVLPPTEGNPGSGAFPGDGEYEWLIWEQKTLP